MEDSRVILISGPAGNLGRAVVQRFQRDAVSFALIDHHPQRLPEIYPDLTAPPHLLLPGVDLLDRDAVQAAVDRVIGTLGRIDCLIHTVGGFEMGETVEDLDDRTWTRMMDLNVRTLLNIARPVIPSMRQHHQGRIITVGARPALEGKARMSAYSAAKSAVLRLTESMSAELRSSGINVNCLVPGTIDTPQNRKAMPQADQSRWVEPASLADVVHFLCSPAAGDIHGAAIPVLGA